MTKYLKLISAIAALLLAASCGSTKNARKSLSGNPVFPALPFADCCLIYVHLFGYIDLTQTRSFAVLPQFQPVSLLYDLIYEFR